MNWLNSHTLILLDVAAVTAGLITYATTNNLLTGKWLALSGVVLAGINLIVAQVNGGKLAKANAKLAKMGINPKTLI